MYKELPVKMVPENIHIILYPLNRRSLEGEKVRGMLWRGDGVLKAKDFNFIGSIKLNLNLQRSGGLKTKTLLMGGVWVIFLNNNMRLDPIL